MKAFPSGQKQNPHHYGFEADHEGLDLRDYFAAKAMQGFIQATTIVSDGLETNYSLNNDDIAKQSYWVADAMMEARK